MKKLLGIICCGIVMLSCTPSGEQGRKEYKGPYLGQPLPGNTPELLAPGFIDTGMEELVITFTPDGNECFWSVRFSGLETILTSRVEKGRWIEPEVAFFAGTWYDGWPVIQPDGKRMFFHSNRPVTNGTSGVTSTFNIWYLDKTASGWSDPQMLGIPVNGNDNTTCPSVTRTGNLYFSKRFADATEKLCRSEIKNGVYQEIEILPPAVNALELNFHGVISPDESYLIRPLYGREDNIGEGWNYYVSFRSPGGEWSDLINLGQAVNSIRCAGTTSFSCDGRYLFFDGLIVPDPIESLGRNYSLKELQERELRDPGKGSCDIYWMDAGFIETLRPQD